ncbi:hypothetical protein [Psychrobacter sp. van23A]|uniref:hypothetical protein n=2 Tax=Psychrobacter TaxID=497 RepID=UPI0027BAD29D|nr:hypothetical protein [Psychrobacter sp. van23A]WLW66054.1 hypothetical protein RAH45_11620 [Psychrobacter sp. van23A]
MKYTLVNPSKTKSSVHSNIFTTKVKCKIDDCLNLTFGTLDKCALHCEKGDYRTDWYNGLLSEFTNLLNSYILRYFKDDYYSYKGLNHHANQLIYELKAYLNTSRDLYLSTVIERFFCEIDIVFSGIRFPTRDSKDSFDYFKTLRMFKGIHFVNCEFYLDNLYIKNISFFFQNCYFNSNFTIHPITLLDNDIDSLFSECTFDGWTRVIPTDDNDSVENTLFSGCVFNSNLTICDMSISADIFDCEEDAKSRISNLTILSSVFKSSLKLNLMKINKLCIEDTEFESKFEIKNSVINILEFRNSNVEKVFDSFESEFEKSYFYKSIFNGFAGFEGVKFGAVDKNTEEYQAKFIYTTFMSFSNFRNTKFLSGLDFENSNLKEQPNFLKTIISPKNTNRETFRIIKKSFDDVGNQLEANRFFVEEMNAYSKELIASDGNYSEKIVFFTNYITSSFGRSYIRPFLLLVLSLCFYVGSYEFYVAWYQSNIYILPEPIHTIAKYLNDGAKSFLPFSRFIQERRGFEFISLIFYVLFAILTWQIIVAVKRHTQR